jgi:Icc-related predicted phosphoesterase
MLISTFADLDRGDINDLAAAVKKAKKPDLLLIAGDVAFMGDSDQTKKYTEMLKIIEDAKWTCPIVAVFGNHESGEPNETEIINKFKDKIHFLRDQSLKLTIKGKTIGIVGSIGVLDSTTLWESDGIVGVFDQFGSSIEKLNKLLKSLDTDIKILLTHYAPTYKTLEGEPEELLEVMGSEVMERILKRTKPDFAIHGHAHHGIPLAFVDKIPVINAAFPVNHKIIELDPDNLPKP